VPQYLPSALSGEGCPHAFINDDELGEPLLENTLNGFAQKAFTVEDAHHD
jgi:hypothetical protein